MPQNTTTSLTAAAVMDKSASLMNDSVKAVYTYDAQLPYLQMALDELVEFMQLNNIPVTDETSDVIQIPTGTTVVNPIQGYGDNTPPNYPANLVQIQQIWERLSGSSGPFVPLTWTWQDQRIKFTSTTNNREIKLDYIKSVFPDPLVEQSPIGIINAKAFLYFRTASLCALFIGENPSRANELNGFAILAVDRLTGIETKGKQGMGVRRRPFNSGYKRRGY